MGAKLKVSVLPRPVLGLSMVSTSAGHNPEAWLGAQTSTRPTPVALDNVYVGSHNRSQMERETPPPSGADDRLSGSADRSPKAGRQLRLVRDGANDSTEDDNVDWEHTRETLEMYRSAYGPATEIIDLSVDEISCKRLARSSFASVVRVRLDADRPILHPGVLELVGSRLSGRDPHVMTDGEYLVASFQVEDESYETRMLAADFAFTLAMLVGGLPRVRVGRDANRNPETHRPKGSGSG